MIEIYKNRFEINLKHLKNFYNLDIEQLNENDTEKILGKNQAIELEKKNIITTY